MPAPKKKPVTRSKAKIAPAKKAARSAPKRATLKSDTQSAARSSSFTSKAFTQSPANADAILKMGTDAVRQMMSVGNKEAQEQMQKQMMNLSKEGAAQLAKSADAASRSLNEMVALSRDNVEAAVTCSSIAVNASKNLGAELFNYANRSFSQNVEMSKEIFGCRTLNDMFDLQSKVMKTNLDHFFNESVKMSEMVFRTANQVSEPINQRMSVTAKRLTKTLSDAA